MAKRKSKSDAAKAVPADEAGFLAFIEAHPDDTSARVAFADWLDEHERHVEAAIQRDAAGLSEVQYKLRRKSDGLFSIGGGGRSGWSPQGKGWRNLAHLRAHIAAARRYGRDYAGTPVSDLEVVILEVRAVTLARLQLEFKKLENTNDVKVTAVVLGPPIVSGSA